MAACPTCGVHPPAGFSFCPDCAWNKLTSFEQDTTKGCSGRCGGCTKSQAQADEYLGQFEGSGLSNKMFEKGPKSECCGKCHRKQKPKTCSRCPSLIEAMGHDPEEFRMAVERRSVRAP
ncbi:MAG: hypothetical protein CMB11_06735 [Euryarchaeota archaeon]|nr:hypothetical protein [Euryarchaeota archaeon]